MKENTITLIKPSASLLDSYLEALAEGSFCNMALGGFADDPRADIVRDPEQYLRKINDSSPRALDLPDGSRFTITDHELLWITDSKRFLGTVSLRYAGDRELLEDYGGHVGLAIRPSLLQKGYGVLAAQAAWQSAAARLASRGNLRAIRATCHPDNRPSKRLIEHMGGHLVGSQENAYGTGPNLIYEIELPAVTS
jgi:predicted acetyltransferase